jgi:hypothetical protein
MLFYRRCIRCFFWRLTLVGLLFLVGLPAHAAQAEEPAWLEGAPAARPGSKPARLAILYNASTTGEMQPCPT